MPQTAFVRRAKPFLSSRFVAGQFCGRTIRDFVASCANMVAFLLRKNCNRLSWGDVPPPGPWAGRPRSQKGDFAATAELAPPPPERPARICGTLRRALRNSRTGRTTHTPATAAPRDDRKSMPQHRE